MNATKTSLGLLLVESNPKNAWLIKSALANAAVGPFEVQWVRNLAEGLLRLRKDGIAAVFTNLSLPDSQGIETLDTLLLVAPRIPIVVLCDSDDVSIALRSVKRGASDYLLKSSLNSHSFSRILNNLMERRAAEDTLFTEREHAQITLDSIRDAVMRTDLFGNVTYMNLPAADLTGWSQEGAIGRPLDEVFHIIDATTRENGWSPTELAMKQNKTVGSSSNVLLVRGDGKESAIEVSAAPIHDRPGRVTGAVLIFHHLILASALATEIANSTQRDFLTGLPNRALLNDRIAQAIALTRRHTGRFAVMFLDLDQFKHINDSLGHLIGDKLLQSVGKRLLYCVRATDTLSRQGGDEFVVLLSGVDQPKDAAQCAQKMLTMLKAPHYIGHHSLEISASIGISVYPDDGLDAETLIKTADTAMYQAKEHGRNNYKFFEQEMNTRAVERQAIEENLRGALDRQEFLLHYQPKINLETGAITGCEALLRWMHPDRGLIHPLLFVPIAEDSGLILPIGRWVLREACRQSQAWRNAGLPPLPVAVNISAVEFRDQNFLESVRSTLKETRLESQCLELELTESVLMQHAEGTAAVLRSLKTMGVQLTVDDFGTGYSSLSYLRRFPIDALKIDRSFVREIVTNPDDATIVSAVINMGHSLKQRVIAEGVETGEQLAFLRTNHCAEGQGYYFSRPMPAEEFAKFMEAGIPESLPANDEIKLPSSRPKASKKLAFPRAQIAR